MNAHAEILERLLEEKIVAIVRLESAEGLLKAADALKLGGISCIEFTFSTPGALDVLKEASGRYGDDVLLGAGTILDAGTARLAILAGAQFIVTPGFNPRTIALAKEEGKPIIAGAMTPTEMLAAHEAGTDLIKVFPASAVGGPAYIRAVLAPLPHLRLVPTGGVSADNAAEYLKAGAVALGVGGKLVDQDAVKRGGWEAITAEARRLAAAVKTVS
ncbi:MAG TPA: bifunctional 4-hydroxy-2-oxoglutarate aldolase/2-dehydro-3-deoxy-phosphogluconate aldolase [Anaerolineales bacterium]